MTLDRYLATRRYWELAFVLLFASRQLALHLLAFALELLAHALGLALEFLAHTLALALALSAIPLVGGFDQWITDQLKRFAAPAYRFEDVLVVDVDERSIAELTPSLGPWPYDRDVFAQLERVARLEQK